MLWDQNWLLGGSLGGISKIFDSEDKHLVIYIYKHKKSLDAILQLKMRALGV